MPKKKSKNKYRYLPPMMEVVDLASMGRYLKPKEGYPTRAGFSIEDLFIEPSKLIQNGDGSVVYGYYNSLASDDDTFWAMTKDGYQKYNLSEYDPENKTVGGKKNYTNRIFS